MNEYPNLWKLGLIQKRVRARAGHCCEQCGMEFVQGTNIAKNAVNKKGKPLIGTCHHIDGNKSNCSMRNLVYLCQVCHFTLHVAYWEPGKMLLKRWKNNPPRWIVERGVSYQMNPNVINAPHLYEAPLF